MLCPHGIPRQASPTGIIESSPFDRVSLHEAFRDWIFRDSTFFYLTFRVLHFKIRLFEILRYVIQHFIIQQRFNVLIFRLFLTTSLLSFCAEI